ncbi:outer membrane lipoprotein carrier protein LolA [Roseomonas alkaliterrae]|uniref:Outer membrane lipoprotein-sorting protein n=1 Tax=Neoroseomonas alkaliterrae TaxID=1452450 RepID=A0A840XLL6_9PROT|nr:outer membrane lipoprotein carrier protein LolA [Neoroseomonas alkaliterrae]MBB5688816.1 outer membrane lipoprotein-sorting protein [Neoroseomonas alkaliterrae]MBR0677310.1 outer membrane lipoprotein carrier protein LolA [Neoroseomonas alkaliterrae]
MRRRSLLAAPLALATPAAAQTRAPAPPPAALNERDRADIARIEAYLNAMTTLRARFLQIAHNGASAEGTAWISRPGRMRFEYDPPEPLLLVADAGQFLMYDRELRAPTTLLVSQTPLGILLRREVRLSGDVTVTGVDRSGGFLRVTMFRTAEPGEGRLTLVFQPEPLALRQWAVTDPQGRETRVTLSRIETGLRLPAGLFQFNDPRFFEPGGFGAPQGPGN